MPELLPMFYLPSCPHCGRSDPTLSKIAALNTVSVREKRNIHWLIYACNSCGGIVAGRGINDGAEAEDYFPKSPTVSPDVPDPAANFLSQALTTKHAPAGCMMLCASAIDAMLKVHGIAEGSLHARIDQAAEEHLITDGMAQWAHKVRLDANDQRHADMGVSPPSLVDAERSLKFALALAEFLFVLPAQVREGTKEPTPGSCTTSTT